MSAGEEIARIRRLELAGVISWLEAEGLEAAVHEGRPTSMVHALARLPLTELQARWLSSRPEANTGAATRYAPPFSRDQLAAQILDRVS